MTSDDSHLAVPGTGPAVLLPSDGILRNDTLAIAGPSPGPADPGNSTAPAPPRQPVHLTVEDWVSEYFLPMFRRTLGGEFRWCAQWWQHGEAISRLTALWHSWEVLRLRPGTGIATWYREYLDHHLPILLGARGPFYQCSETAHREPHEPAVVEAPDDWWDTSRSHEPAVPWDEPLTETPG
jgi:hypothetical protein